MADHLAKKEVKKLAKSVQKLGKWQLIQVPEWILDVTGGQESGLAPMNETQEKVSSQIGIIFNEG